MTTRKLTLIAVLTALYCVLSFCMKFIIVGNTMIDLGYIALTVACCMVGPWAAVVGAVGCGLESLLFSSYGFSAGWFAANLIIGLLCGIYFRMEKRWYLRAFMIIAGCGIGLFGVKAIIECALYGIPLVVKEARIAPQFFADAACMLAGLPFEQYLRRVSHYSDNEVSEV